MKKYLLLVLFLVACSFAEAQNLVSNSSFENHSACPTALGQVDSVVNWFPLKDSPDYFNSCTSVSQLSVPHNVLGFQEANSGNAYCGLVCYYNSPNGREYIGTQLSSQLFVSQKYFISLNLSLSAGLGFTKGCNKFGCKLSTIPFVYGILLPDNNAFFYSDSIITDTTNWVCIKGSFIADSAYNYIAFGNFFDDSHTDTLNVGSNSFDSYYYIDDVCVSTDSLTCNGNVSIKNIFSEQSFTCFPNPANNKIFITINETENYTCELFNLIGEKAKSFDAVGSSNFDSSDLPDGVYILKIHFGNKIIQQKQVVLHQ